MRTLIRNARVLTFDAEDRDLARANILIDGAEIVAVGPDAEFRRRSPLRRSTQPACWRFPA
jgi:hypothetical protein